MVKLDNDNFVHDISSSGNINDTSVKTEVKRTLQSLSVFAKWQTHQLNTPTL